MKERASILAVALANVGQAEELLAEAFTLLRKSNDHDDLAEAACRLEAECGVLMSQIHRMEADEKREISGANRTRHGTPHEP